MFSFFLVVPAVVLPFKGVGCCSRLRSTAVLQKQNFSFMIKMHHPYKIGILSTSITTSFWASPACFRGPCPVGATPRPFCRLRCRRPPRRRPRRCLAAPAAPPPAAPMTPTAPVSAGRPQIPPSEVLKSCQEEETVKYSRPSINKRRFSLKELDLVKVSLLVNFLKVLLYSKDFDLIKNLDLGNFF